MPVCILRENGFCDLFAYFIVRFSVLLPFDLEKKSKVRGNI